MSAKPDFSKVRLAEGELTMLRMAYAETYPVRSLINRIDELEEALLSLLPGLELDLRYADADDDLDAFRSRIATVRDCFMPRTSSDGVEPT